MTLDPHIFKAYDVRGVVPSSLDENGAEAIGRAFAATAAGQGQHTVAVGRDGRISSPSLAQALVRGLTQGGIDVIDVGAVATPMLYFAAATLCESGIQVTASHNPKEYNGFKLVLAGKPLCGEDLQALRGQVERDEARLAAGRATVREVDVFPAYRDRIMADIRLVRPLKVVLDCGNGIPGASAPRVLRAIGCEVIELFTEVDGTFPHHHPDPSRPENLQDLVARVRETGADLGLALDGDGDRLGVVTRSGQIVYPDRQMMLFARDVLSHHPGAPVVFDVKSSQQLARVIESAGGEPVMYKSGYALLKARMKELGAPLAGEMSGHIFFNDRWPGFDDGTYCACRLLEIVSREPDASAALEALPTSFSTPELNIRCAEGEPHRIARQLAQTASFPQAKVSTLDGLRVDWPDGFGLVRASNTTPVLVLRFEGRTQAAMDRIQDEMLALLRTVKPDASLPAAAH